jgi:hypothetical protein
MLTLWIVDGAEFGVDSGTWIQISGRKELTWLDHALFTDYACGRWSALFHLDRRFHQ